MGRKEREARRELVAGRRGSSRGCWTSTSSQSWCSESGARRARSGILESITIEEVVLFWVMARSTLSLVESLTGGTEDVPGETVKN